MKPFMRIIEFVAALVFALSLTACDHVSEKDKMEMIALCDAEGRKKSEDHALPDYGPQLKLDSERNRAVTIKTHYSFSDKKCYALREELETLYDESTLELVRSYEVRVLYDGLTSDTLLVATCTRDIEFGNMETCMAGGTAMGRLSSEWGKSGVATFDNGQVVINARMNRP
jgi:hypothetical protein